MTDAPRERPLSPHTTIWRWHATMATSILHRVTGCGLYGGMLILAAWLTALALGDGPYGQMMALLGSPIGILGLMLLTLCVFFHLAKGVQHLIWDLGAGFKLPTANMGALICLTFSVAATAAVWILAAMMGAL